jgi:hypothetical protein
MLCKNDNNEGRLRHSQKTNQHFLNAKVKQVGISIKKIKHAIMLVFLLQHIHELKLFQKTLIKSLPCEDFMIIIQYGQ